MKPFSNSFPVEMDGIRFVDNPRVMWRADAKFKYAREPLLARMNDGSLICMLYTGGIREPDPRNVVALIRSTDDGETWSRPKVIFSHPHRACWATELNMLGACPELVFQTFDAHNHYMDLRPQRSWTSDCGKTWTRPVSYNGLPPNFTTRQGLRTSDGALVYPIYWQENDGNFTGWMCYGKRKEAGTPWCSDGHSWFVSGAIRSEDEGRTWSFAAVPQPEARSGWHLNQWEPAIVELSNGALKMFVRVECDERVLWESESTDGGRTWTKLHPGAISNPGTKMQVLNHNGEIVLFNNTCDKKNPNRYRLEVMFSKDNCKTWRNVVIADSADSASDGADWFNGSHVQVAYPSAILDDSRRTCYLAVDSIGKFYLLKIPYEKFEW